jgi:hypothetical protein
MFLVTAAVTISTLWLPMAVFEPLKISTSAGSNVISAGIVVTLAGVLVALAGHLLTQGRNAGESVEKQSRFYLDSCVQAYVEAQRLLLDGNNDRVTWIAAARALEHAKELSRRVSVRSHLRVLEIHKLRYRGFFGDVLRGKPASFFYAAKDCTISTDEAARLSSVPSDPAERTCVSTVNALSEKSIHAIWEAAQFPADYQDPLEAGFSETERGKLIVLYAGLHEFLEHSEQWLSAAGCLYPRKKPGDR